VRFNGLCSFHLSPISVPPDGNADMDFLLEIEIAIHCLTCTFAESERIIHFCHRSPLPKANTSTPSLYLTFCLSKRERQATCLGPNPCQSHGFHRALHGSSGSLHGRGMFRLTILVQPPKRDSDDLHPGARHEKSSSRLRQRQNGQSHSDGHNAGPT